MKKIHFISMLIVALMITGATSVSANPRGIMWQHEQPGLSPLAQINLSTQQTEKIRILRVAYEESITPLKLQEHQIKAELNIFWLQLTLDTKKLKSAQKKIHDIKFQILEKETDFQIAMRKVLTEDQLSRFLALGGSGWHAPGEFNHHPPRPQQSKRY